MNDKFLEQFYKNLILPRYKDEINLADIKWIDHGKVGLDTWAHYFERGGKEYALLNDDPLGGEYLNDDLSHVIVKIDGKSRIGLSFDDVFEIPNITGWFMLYVEKPRSALLEDKPLPA